MKTRRLVAAAAVAGLPGLAAAQAPVDEPQVIEVTETKNPAVMPYRKAYDLVAKVEQSGSRRLHAVFRVTSPKSKQPVPGLRVAIEGENTHRPVEVSESGLVALPYDPAAYDENAELVANKPKEALQVGFFVTPKLPAGPIRYGDVAESVSDAQSAIAQLVPWYFRLFIPSVKGVGLCYPDANHTVSIEGVPEGTRAAREPERDVADRAVYCAKFSAAEALENKAAVIAPPDGWVAIFW